MVKWHEQPGVVVVQGSDGFLLGHELSEAKSRLSDHVLFELDAQEDGAALKSILWAPSLLTPERLIIVKAANRIDDPLVLQEYCADPDPGTVLILCRSGRTAKWFRDLPRTHTLALEPPKPWEIEDWLVDWSLRKGYMLSKPMAKALKDNVGTDLWSLTGELTKVFYLMGERRDVQGGDITKVLVQHEQLKPWLIVDAWAQRKEDLADRYLTLYIYQTRNQGTVLPVVSIFLKRIRNLITYSSARRSSVSDSEIRKMVDVSPVAYKEIQAQSAAWELRELRAAYKEMCDIDYAAKTGQDAVTMLHLFMYSTSIQ